LEKTNIGKILWSEKMKREQTRGDKEFGGSLIKRSVNHGIKGKGLGKLFNPIRKSAGQGGKN